MRKSVFIRASLYHDAIPFVNASIPSALRHVDQYGIASDASGKERERGTEKKRKVR